MKVLVCSSGATLSLATANKVLSALSVSPGDDVLLASSFNPSTAGVRDFDLVASVSSQGQAQATFLAAIREKILGTAGRLALVEPVSASAPERLQRELLMCGLTDITAGPACDGLSIALGTRPAWSSGAKQPLKLKSSAPAPSAWKVAPSEEEELIDEDDLLSADDLKRPAPPASDDCELGAGGARKACKNCTCGRAEMEEGGPAVALTTDDLANATSACGNCYLGDAFRCGSCPYKGLPPFKPGEKVALGADALAMDA